MAERLTKAKQQRGAKPPRAPRRSPLESADPHGRVDVLASRVLEWLVANAGCPWLERLYRAGRAEIDRDLIRRLGPQALSPAAREFVAAVIGSETRREVGH